jgi:hypothetical protein
MVNVHPRYSWVANSASITLDATDSQQRSKAAATGITFTKLFGSGTLVDNADGTCTYTAPASGSGTFYITVKTAGNTTGVTAAVVYGNSNLNVGSVTSFSASLSSGGWEMTLRGYGDCTGLERQKGILLVCDDYWNGSEDTFGGYKWAHGVFFGWVDRMRTVFMDSEEHYLEVRVISSYEVLNYGSAPDAFFSATDTGEEDLVHVTGLEAVDAAWIYVQESGLNDQINFHFFDDGNTITNLKVERGPFMDVIRDIVGRTFGICFSSKLGDIYMPGDPDIRRGA